MERGARGVLRDSAVTVRCFDNDVVGEVDDGNLIMRSPCCLDYLSELRYRTYLKVRRATVMWAR